MLSAVHIRSILEGYSVKASIAFGSPPNACWLGETPDPLGVRKEICVRKRNVTITVRCTEDERDKIKARAAKHGLKLSDFVLRLALGKRIVVADGLDEAVRQMKAVGNNANQIARAVNEGRLQTVQLGEVRQALYLIYGRLGEILREVR